MRLPRIISGVAAVLVAAGLWWYLSWWRDPDVATLLSHLPQARVIGFMDFSALRTGGMMETLFGQRTGEEAEYKQFVADTGFDYRRHLDRVLLAYSRQETLILAQGEFDWARIEAYAKKQGGTCSNGVCRMGASSPGRQISIERLRRRTLAVATSTDPEAVAKIRKPVTSAKMITPFEPVWFLIPPAILKDDSMLPAGTRMFATALAESDQIAIAASGDQKGFEARLYAQCRTAEQATQVKRELEAATKMLVRMLAREKQEPNPRDLSGVLARGEFQTEGTRLTGRWPIEPVFLESLTGPPK